jgi:putative proteasome-type protease
MTYCLGIVTKEGLVLAGDSRTNAGHEQVATVRKLHTFCTAGERAFMLLTSGSLSCAQSVVALLRGDYDAGRGLAKAASMYDAARLVGQAVRAVATLDRESLERDGMQFNLNLLMGGQIGTATPELYQIYPQGNPLRATEDCPYLQIGEVKYGRPILDRGVRFDKTSLEDAARYALISLDSTMKSNATVGPPIDLLMYRSGDLDVRRRRRLEVDDPLLVDIRLRWDRALRDAIQTLPVINLQPEGK